MKVEILREAGYEEALLGLSLSYNQPLDRMPRVALKMYQRGDGECKFLRQICVWLDITAPRYWWCQMDTYSVGKTQQSESTMHTILRRQLAQEDFEVGIPTDVLFVLNNFIRLRDFQTVKRILPEAFLQRRIICTNYQTLRRIIRQRKNHKLLEWQQFISAILQQVKHREFFDDLR